MFEDVGSPVDNIDVRRSQIGMAIVGGRSCPLENSAGTKPYCRMNASAAATREGRGPPQERVISLWNARSSTPGGTSPAWPHGARSTTTAGRELK
jgi:hypothetical protein